MIESRKSIRPFFIAATKEHKDSNRPCDVSSENVCAIRPAYVGGRPSTTQTVLVLNAVESGNGVYVVNAPYEVVRKIFSDRGYELLDENALKDAADALRRERKSGMEMK
jgi:hypothetical protein